MKSSSKAVKRKASELTTTLTANALSDASSKALDQAIKLSKTLQLTDLQFLSGKIDRMLHERLHRFCKFVECTKEEAGTASLGYITDGEMGGDYGYFVGSKWCDDSQQYATTRELTKDQKEIIENNPECCYYHGCVCNLSEDCECVSGREYATLILIPVNEYESESEDDLDDSASDDSTKGHPAGCACVTCFDDPQDVILNERTQTYVNPNYGSDFEMMVDGFWVLKARKKDKVSVQFHTGKLIGYVKEKSTKKNDCFLVQFENEEKWIELSPELHEKTWKLIFNSAKTI